MCFLHFLYVFFFFFNFLFLFPHSFLHIFWHFPILHVSCFFFHFFARRPLGRTLPGSFPRSVARETPG